MFNKSKKENRLSWYDTGPVSERRKKLLRKLMILYNPMFSIEFGRPNEVFQARALAEKIVIPLNYSAEVMADCKNMLSVFILYQLYKSVKDNKDCFGTGYQGEYITSAPTLDFLLRYFKGNIVEEIDNDGEEEHKYCKVKSFSDLLSGLISDCSDLVEDGAVVTCMANRLYNGEPILDYVVDYKLNCCEIMNRYREHNDGLVEFCITDTHPWIYYSLLSLSFKKKNLLNECAYQCVLAIEDYLDRHPYAVSYKIRELFEWNIDRVIYSEKDSVVKFDFNPVITYLNGC